MDHLPQSVQAHIRQSRGKNREMAIEIAEALLPILRKHRRRFKDRYHFAGATTHDASICIDVVREE